MSVSTFVKQLYLRRNESIADQDRWIAMLEPLIGGDYVITDQRAQELYDQALRLTDQTEREIALTLLEVQIQNHSPRGLAHPLIAQIYAKL